MQSQKAILAGRVFTGENWLDDQAVITEAGIIKDLLPASAVPDNVERDVYPDAILVPAYIDLQIYGAYGKLLAVYPEPDALVKLNEYCRSGGAPLCMPTVATNTYEVFYAAIDAIRSYWQHGGEGVMGLHIEGPWINPVKRGAHIEELVHAPSMEQVRDLLEYGKGVIRIITLAPEVVTPEITDLIRSYGIVISAGHSNATYAQAKAGFAKGITAVTHLYNAMSPLLHREPGLAGAAMDDETVMASIIPDGYHVDYAAVRIAKAVMKERLFVITDAVTDTDQGQYPHQRNGDKYESGGILSGSALTMQAAMLNLVRQVGVEPDEAIRMCSLYPARVMGIDHQYGKIQQGYKASMLLLDQQLELIKLL